MGQSERKGHAGTSQPGKDKSQQQVLNQFHHSHHYLSDHNHHKRHRCRHNRHLNHGQHDQHVRLQVAGCLRSLSWTEGGQC